MYGGKSWKGAVIHHSASAAKKTDRSIIDSWHKARGFKKKYHAGQYYCGYHFVIHWNGIIETGRPLDMTGAHAKGFNDSHLGICILGNFENHSPTWDQYKSLVRLLRDLQEIFNFPDSGIIPHSKAGNTKCPGKYFRMDVIFRDLHKTV